MSRGEYEPTGTLRDNDIVGAIADAIGKNVGKLKPQVIRKDEKGMVIKNDYLARLLSLRPCPEMSTYDFLYRIAVDLVYTSNSFSVIFWNKDFTRVESIQPITTTSYRIFEDDKNNILFRFRWDYDGKTYTVPYQNVIHVKARYNKRRFLGTTPDMELKRSLDLIETSGETIKNIVNRSNSLAGYLKYNNIADDEELKEIARNFQDAYMNKDNAGGIAAIDNTVEFKEISQRTPSIPTNQITFLRDNIYRYYGVNDKILTSTLNDTEFISFYENVIEPISVQLSYEFTFKLLTPREIGYGNRIDFVANLLQYATLQTRETIGGGMFDRGALTINEYRELMYYGPVEDGDQRLVSLNYVKVGDQSLYQVGQQNEPPDDAGANDREKRAMQAATRAYMQIMKGGLMEMPQIKQFIACKNAKTATVKPFCEIKNITDTTADLYFYGDIVSDWWGAWQEEDQYPDAIKNFLAEANGRDLNIYINSGGGSVFAGIAIYNMLKRYQGKKHCFVDALAGSIASLFPFVDSDKPTIPKNAYLMIHKPWCDCEGNANELRKMADTLEAIEAGIWSIYEEHLAEGVTIEQIKELMEAETWLSGEEAAKYFNVSVGEENTAVAAVQDYTKLYCKNTPEALAGGNPPDDTKDQAAAKEKEIRSKIAALTIQHME